MKLSEFADTQKKRTRKNIAEHQKKRRKMCTKRRKWANKMLKRGYFITLGDYTKCLDCGKLEYNIRLGCSCWQSGQQNLLGVTYGIALNTGKIGNGRKYPFVQQSEFLSNLDLINRLKKGDRFFDIADKQEQLLNQYSSPEVK